MLKVIQINTTFRNGGSTGRIAYDLLQIQRKEGIDAYAAYGHETGAEYVEKTICLQSAWQRKMNILRTRLFDHHGFYNEAETRKLIRWIDGIRPDIIHLHNIHNHYVNVKMLFDYIKRHNIPVVWTLHDCWSFTGHCAYFDYAHCDKWKTGCHECMSLKDYPPTWFFDRTKRNYADKKATFTGVKNLTLVPPSEWLGHLTRESFLKNYPVKVINNGVDTTIFKPTESDIKKKLGIEGKKMILSVASIFNKRKGIEYIHELPTLLNSNEVLVIVGVKPTQESYFKQDKCIVINRTNDIQELVAFYSAADVFINPTLEDNFPTTNIEALACGTPIVTFNTGGSVESVTPDTGIIVKEHNLESLINTIRTIIKKGKSSYSIQCREKAVKNYNKDTQYQKYIELYRQILNK